MDYRRCKRKKKKVAGEGVIGLQPILEAGETFEYNSWVQIMTPLGQMSGEYLMKNIEKKFFFFVSIPVFTLVQPQALN